MRGESVIGAEFYHGLGLGRNSSRSWVVVLALLAASTTHIPCRGAR
jgi:hypothetical protein